MEILAEVGRQGPVAGHEIDGTVGLIVAPGGVQRDPVPLPGKLQVVGVPAAAGAVVVHEVSDAEAPLGNDTEGLLPHHGRCVGLVSFQSGQRGLLAEAAEHLQQAFLGPVGGGHQRPGVALKEVRIPGIPEDDPVGLFVQFPLVQDLDWRHQCAVVEYLGVGRADAAGPGAAQVPEMGEGMAVGHRFALEEHGGQEHHIRGVGDAALGDVGVVVPVQVAGGHGLDRVILPDAPDDVAAHVVAVELMAVPVQEADLIGFLLPDEGRHGRALDEQFALQPGRPQGASDQLPGHRVHGLDFVAFRHFPGSMMQLPYSSIFPVQPGLIRTVESMPSRMAGPSILLPGASRSRS